MPYRNEIKHPVQTWWTVMKYPLEGFAWWLDKVAQYLFGRGWLFCCGVRRSFSTIANGTTVIIEFIINIVRKFINFIVRTVSNITPPEFKFTSWIRWPSLPSFSNRMVPVGVLYAVDSTKKTVKLGVVYTSEKLKAASYKVKENTYYLLNQADIAAYRIRQKASDSALGIRDFFGNIFRTLTNFSTERLKQGISGSLVSVRRGCYGSAEKVKIGFVILKDQSREIASSAGHSCRNMVYKFLGFFQIGSLPIGSFNNLFKSIRIPLPAYLWHALLAAILIAYFAYEVQRTYRGELLYRSLLNDRIREGCRQFMLDNVTLKEIMKKLLEQINLGLNHNTRDKSSVKCYNTYVQDLPTGKEKGKFLALDLGGTNFRVLLIKLDGRHYEMQSKIYAIPASIMTGSGTDLFDHIAQCLESFTKEHRVSNEKLPLGFTFSFPVKQIGLEKGILTSWTKGFSCEGVIGEDVVALLTHALEKKNIKLINIVALLNDTTGTLMSCAWKNHNCKIGLILGTGTNACYVEKVENVQDFDGDHNKPYVLINTEWGAFGDHGELNSVLTSYDQEVDKNSINPGKQRHEKMISGMYLGEIVRLLIVKFTQEKILFNGQSTDQLLTRGLFLTEYVSDIESDKRGSFKNCKNVMEKLGLRHATFQDCANIRYICECVTRRAAHLASAGLATLINKMQIPSVTIGVDGTLYRKHPYFHDIMMEKIAELIDPSIKSVHLMLSTDGSGRGAALIAATASTSHGRQY